MVTRIFTQALVLTLIAPLAIHAAALPDGCGDASAQYKVKTEKKASLSSAPAGSAQLVFVQSLDGEFAGQPITRFGVDGSWVGADKGASYFVVTVAPGAHKVCAARQSGASAERDNVGASVVHADAGKTYFFNFTIKRNEIGAAGAHAAGQMLGYATPDMTAKPKDTIDTAEFQPLDEATGTARTQKFAVSTGTPK